MSTLLSSGVIKNEDREAIIRLTMLVMTRNKNGNPKEIQTASVLLEPILQKYKLNYLDVERQVKDMMRATLIRTLELRAEQNKAAERA